MIDLGFINVAGAVVGQSFTIDWSKARIEPTLKQQGNNITDSIAIYNESGVGFTLYMNQTGRSFTLPAGGWAPSIACTVPGGIDLNLTLTVEYLLPAPAVSQVHTDYFGPGESPSGASIVLGNSPINGTVSNVVANAIVNTGNSPGTPVITTNSSPGLGSINANNDGSGNRNLFSAGNFEAFESFTNGTALAEAVVTYGVASDLTATTFNGVGNFQDVTIGALVSAGGTPTIGHWVEIARGNRVHVTSNVATLIAGITAPVNGTYRVSAYFNKQNAAASAVTFTVQFTDPDDATVQTLALSCNNGSNHLALNGLVNLNAVHLMCFTVEFPCVVGASILVDYTDPAGIANDNVTADIELFVI